MSVLAADYRYKEPRKVPRPHADRARRRRGPSKQGENGTSTPGEVMAFFGGRVIGGA